ncbi:MAG: hypothetical protein HC914_18985, partial [Chloroflexaceae bacterium]|nr:hypothetical protein [Chloroflexaceae bacterium]
MGGEAPADPAVGLALVLVLGLSGVLVVYRHSRRLQAVIGVTLIGILVLQPLLMSLNRATFFETRQATAAEQEAHQAVATAPQESQAEQATRRDHYDPHVDPLTRAERQGAALVVPDSYRTLSSTMPLTPTLQQSLADTTTDTDEDGVTDVVEERIGTFTTSADTDNDLLPDKLEVAGFAFAGQMWYPDPLTQDTNNDGLPDGLEYGDNGDGIPDDTDSDGIPDMFDDDNDNDGVPDQLDLGPQVVLGQEPDVPFGQGDFREDGAFNLIVEDATPGQPLFVDFQLRPQDPDHLWYAFQVLDWPEDERAQFQDTDNATFADVAISNGQPMMAPNEDFGDMRLIPMLEIRIFGDTLNLPDPETLESYNIVVLDLVEDGLAGKAAYVPLVLQTDQATGARVAFTGRMPYLPGEMWGNAHAVRLSWVVQALLDICEETANGICTRYSTLNQAQVMHTYYDSWSLTGLRVREDHGTDLAIAYEDPNPEIDTALDSDGPLWSLVDYLDSYFLTAPDNDGDGTLDFGVQDIVDRFNHETNNIPSGERDPANLPDDRDHIPNTLRVVAGMYDSLDTALNTTIITNTLDVLQGNFSRHWSPDDPVYPLLLFAYAEQERTLILSELDTADGFLDLRRNTLTVDFYPTGTGEAGVAQPVTTNHMVQWSLYCGTDTSEGNPSWDTCDLETSQEILSERLLALQDQSGEEPDVFEGLVILTQLYFLAVAEGLGGLVALDGEPVPTNPELNEERQIRPPTVSDLPDPDGFLTAIYVVNFALGDDEEERRNLARSVVFGVNSFLRQSTRIGLQLNKDNESILRALNDANPSVKDQAKLTSIGLLGVTLALSTTGFIFRQVGDAVGGSTGRGFVITGSSLNVLGAVVNGLRLLNNLRVTISTGSSVFENKLADPGPITGLVFGAVSTGIFFIIAASLSGFEAGSVELNALFFDTVARLIVVVIMFFISATIIGQLLLAVVSIIDTFIRLLCDFGVTDNIQDVPGLEGTCFSINEGLVRGISVLLFFFDIMVDPASGGTFINESGEREQIPLLASGPIDTQLANEQLGYVTGNPLRFSMPVTLTIIHKVPEAEGRGFVAFYQYLYDKDNLRSTSYRAGLSAGLVSPLAPVRRGEMRDEWQGVRDSGENLGPGLVQPRYTGQTTTTLTAPPVALPAGINNTTNLFLNFSYAFPAIECFTIIVPVPLLVVVPVCHDDRVLAGTESVPFDVVRYDILPNTIDEFMALSDAAAGGLRQAWDGRFTALRDPDNDGLIASTFGGIDPDNTTWDADGDGLADRTELERRAAGENFNTQFWDTDRDGLTDAQEAELGTNPARPDTDNDGLSDSEERVPRGLT